MSETQDSQKSEASGRAASAVERLVKRLKQLLCPHGFENSRQIGKKRNGHIRDDEEWVYTENIWRCKCGKTWKDCGFEPRAGMTEWLKQGGA